MFQKVNMMTAEGEWEDDLGKLGLQLTSVCPFELGSWIKNNASERKCCCIIFHIHINLPTKAPGSLFFSALTKENQIPCLLSLFIKQTHIFFIYQLTFQLWQQKKKRLPNDISLWLFNGHTRKNKHKYTGLLQGGPGHRQARPLPRTPNLYKPYNLCLNSKNVISSEILLNYNSILLDLDYYILMPNYNSIINLHSYPSGMDY